MRISKLYKFVMMFVLLCSATAATASTAQAWTTNGPLNYTATAPAALLVINATPNAVGVNCTGIPTGGNRATGNVNAATNNPTTPFFVGNVNMTWSGCTAAGFAANVSCQPAQLYANSYAAPLVTGEIRSVNCTITIPSLTVNGVTCQITVTGSGALGRAVYGTYNNATGQLTVLNPSTAGPPDQRQTLLASWNQACTIFQTRPGSASARISNKQNAPLVYTVTSTPRPNIVNP